jgi:type II secretory pathway pseudopilin PulG
MTQFFGPIDVKTDNQRLNLYFQLQLQHNDSTTPPSTPSTSPSPIKCRLFMPPTFPNRSAILYFQSASPPPATSAAPSIAIQFNWHDHVSRHQQHGHATVATPDDVETLFVTQIAEQALQAIATHVQSAMTAIGITAPSTTNTPTPTPTAPSSHQHPPPPPPPFPTELTPADTTPHDHPPPPPFPNDISPPHPPSTIPSLSSRPATPHATLQTTPTTTTTSSGGVGSTGREYKEGETVEARDSLGTWSLATIEAIRHERQDPSVIPSAGHSGSLRYFVRFGGVVADRSNSEWVSIERLSPVGTHTRGTNTNTISTPIPAKTKGVTGPPLWETSTGGGSGSGGGWSIDEMVDAMDSSGSWQEARILRQRASPTLPQQQQYYVN